MSGLHKHPDTKVAQYLKFKLKEIIMYLSQTSVRNILETKFGAEKAGNLMRGISHSYKNGKRGEDLSQFFTYVVKKEGIGTSNITLPIIRI